MFLPVSSCSNCSPMFSLFFLFFPHSFGVLLSCCGVLLVALLLPLLPPPLLLFLAVIGGGAVVAATAVVVVVVVVVVVIVAHLVLFPLASKRISRIILYEYIHTYKYRENLHFAKQDRGKGLLQCLEILLKASKFSGKDSQWNGR